MNYRLTLPNGTTVYPVLDIGQNRWGNPVDDDDQPCEVLAAPTYGKDPTIIAVNGTTETITFTRPTVGPILDYQLDDPDMVSVKFPLTITPEQRAELHEDDQYRYSARRSEATPEQLVVPVGGYEPWPADSDVAWERPDLPEHARWTPAKTWGLLFGIPSHDHIIPGNLQGFHKAAAALIAAAPHRAAGWSNDVRIERDVAKRVQFVFLHEDGLSQTVKVARRKTQRPLHQSVYIDVVVGLDHVHGTDMVDAIERWNQRLDAVAAQFPDPAVVCAHCRGVGFVLPGGKS